MNGVRRLLRWFPPAWRDSTWQEGSLLGLARRDLATVGAAVMVSAAVLAIIAVVTTLLLGGGRLSSDQIAAQVGTPAELGKRLGIGTAEATVRRGFELESNIVPSSIDDDACLGIYFPTYRPDSKIALAVAPTAGGASGAATAWTYSSSRSAAAEFRDLDRTFTACTAVVGRVVGGESVVRRYTATATTTAGGTPALDVAQLTVRSSTTEERSPSSSTVHYYLLDATVFGATCQAADSPQTCADYFADFEERLDALADSLG